MSPNDKNLLALAAVGIVIYIATRKKRKAGDLIIGDPYDGEFLDDHGNVIPKVKTTANNQPLLSFQDTGATQGQQQQGGMLINYVGPFEVQYKTGSGNLISGMY